jgi:hypothetical protein
MTYRLFASFLLLFCCFCSYKTITNPIKSPDEEVIIVTAIDGQENVTIFCQITTNDFPLNWTLYNQSTNSSYPLTVDENDIVIDFPFIKIINSSNLTIEQFTSAMDRLQLKCSSYNISATFLLGIPKLPMLELTTLPELREGNRITIDLFPPDTMGPFPPIITSTWNFTAPTNAITLTDYTITIDPLNRTHSGTYGLTVRNDIGSASINFTLSVLYALSGVEGNSNYFAVVGHNATIIGYSDIIGNPSPHVKFWFHPSAYVIHSGGRFAISDDGGQLYISNVTNEDFGDYTVTIESTFSFYSVLSREVSLIKAIIPGPPQELQYHNVTGTAAILSWMAPIQGGLPKFTHYIVTIGHQSSIKTIQTSVRLNNLHPNTGYNATVRSASPNFIEGGEHALIEFVTSYYKPELLSFTAVVNDGVILLQWRFNHLGGVDENLIEIEGYCKADNSTTDQLDFSCIGQSCFTDQEKSGNETVGLLLAGRNYDCAIIASNYIGNDTRTVRNIIATEGIPSVPIIVYMTTSTSEMIFALKCEYPGVTNIGDIVTFSVVILTSMDSVAALIVEEISIRNYTGNTTVVISVQSSYEDEYYYANITARNKFGVSSSNNIEIEIQSLDHTFTITPHDADESSSYLYISTSSVPVITPSITMSLPTNQPIIDYIGVIIMGAFVLCILLVLISTTILYFFVKKKNSRK